MRERVRALVLGRDMALDPDGLWRADDAFAHRVGWGLNSEADPGVLFRRAGALGRADALAALCDWASVAPAPVVRAAGRLLAGALAEAIERGEPIGRALGLEPPSGARVSHAVKLAKRDAMLRALRAATPAWRALPPRRAAAAMAAAFRRYAVGGWTADRRRSSAPAVEPAATWWRVLRLGLAVAVPGVDRLAEILDF